MKTKKTNMKLQMVCRVKSTPEKVRKQLLKALNKLEGRGIMMRLTGTEEDRAATAEIKSQLNHMNRLLNRALHDKNVQSNVMRDNRGTGGNMSYHPTEAGEPVVTHTIE